MEPREYQSDAPQAAPNPYPAVCHLSIIAEARTEIGAALRAALAPYELVAPLEDGGATASRRYRALRVSVALASREAHEALDRDVRAVPGVRMIL